MQESLSQFDESTMSLMSLAATVDGEEDTSVSMEGATRAMAVQALAISVQDWKVLGRGEDPSVAACSTLEEAAERITALMLVRIVGILSPPGSYKDLSTTTICRTALIDGNAWYPDRLTPEVIKQLRTFVTRLLHTYQDLPFHNFQHAYHVTISANKLLDLMLSTSESSNSSSRRPPTYGLRNDPLALFALLFASLIHDAEHKGVTNRRMVEEKDELALLYNDQSVHEQRSLHLAFEELLKDRYNELREVMFPSKEEYRSFRMTVVNAVLSTDLANPERTQITKSKWKEAFGESQDMQAQRNARRSVMGSDINLSRGQSHRYGRRGSNVSDTSDVTTDTFYMNQRKNDVEQRNARHQRRTSNESYRSDYDSVAFNQQGGKWNSCQERRLSAKSAESVLTDYGDDDDDDEVRTGRRQPYQERRFSGKSVGSVYSEYAEDSVAFNKTVPKSPTKRRASNDSEFSDFANDSVAMAHKQYMYAPRTPRGGRRGSTNSMRSYSADSLDFARGGKPSTLRSLERLDSIPSQSTHTKNSDALNSFAADSIALHQQRQAGQATTKNRLAAMPVSVPLNDGGMVRFDVSEFDSDDSLSLTPPSSDDEGEGETDDVAVSTLPMQPPKSPRRGIRPSRSMEYDGDLSAPFQRRASTGNKVPERIDEEGPTASSTRSDDGGIPMTIRSERVGKQKYSSRRLSICRSIDLSGESIETYSRKGSISGTSVYSEVLEGTNHGDYDEPDALREAVVLELLLRVADVAHSLQTWDSMVQWSSSLFHELMAANKAERGFDPSKGWFDNQVLIMDSYLMPLANQLEDTGVFGDAAGRSFQRILDENHDRWLREGPDLIEKMLSKT